MDKTMQRLLNTEPLPAKDDVVEFSVKGISGNFKGRIKEILSGPPNIHYKIFCSDPHLKDGMDYDIEINKFTRSKWSTTTLI